MFNKLLDPNEKIVLESEVADIPEGEILGLIVVLMLIAAGLILPVIWFPDLIFLVILGAIFAAFDIWVIIFYLQQKALGQKAPMAITETGIILFDERQEEYIKIPFERIISWSHKRTRGYMIGSFIFKTANKEHEAKGIGNYREVLRAIYELTPANCENPPPRELLEPIEYPEEY